MTALEIDRSLTDIMLTQGEVGKQKLANLPPDAKQERKAVQIEIGIYSLFVRFGQLYTMKKGAPPEEQREHVLYIREQMMLREKQLSVFPKFEKMYYEADVAEKQRLIAAYHAEIQMRCQMAPKYRQHLLAAKQSGDVDEAFEAGIKIAVMEEGFRLWEEWRRAHGVYPCLMEME